MSDWHEILIEFTDKHPNSEEISEIKTALMSLDDNFRPDEVHWDYVVPNFVGGRFPDYIPLKQFMDCLSGMGYSCRGMSAPENQDGDFIFEEWEEYRNNQLGVGQN